MIIWFADMFAHPPRVMKKNTHITNNTGKKTETFLAFPLSIGVTLPGVEYFKQLPIISGTKISFEETGSNRCLNMVMIGPAYSPILDVRCSLPLNI